LKKQNYAAIKDVNRASDVIDRIHRLEKKDTLRMEKLDINGAILEVISLIHSEVIRNGVTVGTELAEILPRIQGDRVQLILNLLINAIQAMGDLAEGQRKLHVSTAPIESEGVHVAVQDTGPGLRPQDLERLFVPFYDKAQRHGCGPINLPVDHRRPRRAVVGSPVRASRCSVSVYDPRDFSRIVITSMSLFGSELVCCEKRSTSGGA
jgi:nitrogen-specific signal transduction histidine kinase